MGAARSARQLVERLVELFAGKADELFQREDLAPFLPEHGLLVAGIGTAFQLLDVPPNGLKFLVDVAGDDDHVLKNLLPVIKFREGGLVLFVELLELGKK